jgi:hypothetical protein
MTDHLTLTELPNYCETCRGDTEVRETLSRRSEQAALDR